TAFSITSPTSAIAQINVPVSAATGAHSITITTNGEIATLSNAFTVSGIVPALVSVNPAAAQQGDAVDVSITGAATSFQPGVTSVSAGAGIVVTNVNVKSSTSVSAHLAIDPLAVTGLRSITVTTGGQVLTLNNAFTVNPGPAVISQVNPSQVNQGDSLAVLLT